MRILTAASVLLALTLVTAACGSNDISATATASLSDAAPTAFIAPTTESLAGVAPVEADLLGLGARRSFPTELLKDAARLPGYEAASLWTEFLSNVRVIDSQNVNMVDFCGDGTGHFFTVTTDSMTTLAGESFTWEVFPAVGGRWNEPKLRITPMNSAVPLSNFTGNPYVENVMRAPEIDPGADSSARAEFATALGFPGILHPNEIDSAFEFHESAETICR